MIYYYCSAFMLNEPHILIHVEDFLFNPIVTQEGETDVDGVYCLQCLLDIDEVVDLIELWRSPEIGVAYCPLCNQEILLQRTFEELQKEVKLKLANEDWRITKLRKVSILEPLKVSPPKKPEPN